MKIFKQIDFYISLALVAGFSMLVMMQQVSIFKAYFITGGWQVFSMIVHTFNGWFMKKGGARDVYHWVVIVILLCVLVSQVLTPFLFIFYLLLIGSPVLAVIYTCICLEELKELKKSHMQIFK